ncbi:hypothetical protein [Sphingorhabdus sp.]|uniref:hypothetical protein n=1 Tax=Sphingorhabdus sp. TaxID=1902408 RepID=UPI003BAF3CA0|nr:hypothetical protein [Sphingomonadales bacterium]MBK9433106.1 hypothetical protein [Sphingomonadales bacterium]MBL0021684.1 hypothetical protein [Sphingomonadales bacterium]
MSGPASQSDEILDSARRSLKRVRMGPPIGTKSRALRRAHLFGKIARAATAVGVILVGAGVAGAILNGIGFWGVMATALVGAAAGWYFLRFPQLPLPTMESLRQTDLATLAGKTEIWLESQRPALPAPAIPLVQNIGLRLDALAPQLQTLGETDPASREVRKLVGEHLPELINGYKRIPEPLRRQDNSGKTPEQQLVDGLKRIDREIETMTGQIARGELDKLATRERYLEIRYDGGEEASA